MRWVSYVGAYAWLFLALTTAIGWTPDRWLIVAAFLAAAGFTWVTRPE